MAVYNLKNGSYNLVSNAKDVWQEIKIMNSHESQAMTNVCTLAAETSRYE